MHSNFLHIENNHFVGSNGVIGAAYLVELPQKYSLSEQDFDLLVESWAKAFAMLENAIILKSDIYLTDTFDTQKIHKNQIKLILVPIFYNKLLKDISKIESILNTLLTYFFLKQISIPTLIEPGIIHLKKFLKISSMPLKMLKMPFLLMLNMR